MLFNAPEVFTQIPEIKQIYRMNDRQAAELDRASENLWNDIYLTGMGSEKLLLWEKILGIRPYDTDTMEERHFRVRSRVLEKLPYTYRVVKRKIEELAPGRTTFDVDEKRERALIKLDLESRQMFSDAVGFIERVLPLNMTYRAMMLSWAVIDQNGIEKIFLQKTGMHAKVSFFGTRLLNGSHFLDGSHHLNEERRYWLIAGISYRAVSVQNRGFFSLQVLAVKGEIITGWEKHTGAVFRSGIGFKTAGCKGSKVVKICLCIKEPREKIENAVATTKTKDYRFLNGSKFLDGSKKLDSVYREEKL